MKTTLLQLTALFALCGGVLAHERITLGPEGGRLIAIDSVTTPNAEFKVTTDGRLQIGFLDKDRKPMPVGDRKLTVTAGERSSAKKLTTEIKDDRYLTETAPEGKDYYVIMQLREPGASKSKTFRLHYNLAVCGECTKPEWLCSCGTKNSGRNIEVPATLESLWTEINQHSQELTEGAADSAYDPVDEVTEALPVLAAALPGMTESAKKAEAGKLVAELQASLAAIRSAFAARKPADARQDLETLNKTLAALKAIYPAEVANAKLKK